MLDSGARGSTNSFVIDKKGDVLVSWENEALLSLKEAPDEYELVTPSISILAEPSVAVVDAVVARKGTRRIALYSPEGQEIVAAINRRRPKARRNFSTCRMIRRANCLRRTQERLD